MISSSSSPTIDSQELQKFDLVVIGSGSGLDVANAAFQHGLRVAVVEKDRLGGTCLNRGCIPSKLLIHSADVVETIKQAELFGIRVDGYSIQFEKIVERVNKKIDSDSDEIRDAFEGVENPKLFLGECKFVGPKTIGILHSGTQSTIGAEKILIATGSRPRIPDINGLSGTGYITSDEALRIKTQPHILTIIGGGYIASELAHFFGALGTKINIVQRGNLLIPHEDEEVARKFTQVFSKKYNVYLGYDTESVGKKNGGIFFVKARNSSGKVISLESDQLLVATGRTPNSDTLDLGKTGVQVDGRGFVRVNKYLETNVKGIFALGDAVGRYMFKHSANYAKAVYPYIRTAMGEAIEDRDGFVKLLASRKDGRILGCHIIGAHASILIHEVLVAMKAGVTIGNIARTVHIHPALSEVVSRAASSF